MAAAQRGARGRSSPPRPADLGPEEEDRRRRRRPDGGDEAAAGSRSGVTTIRRCGMAKVAAAARDEDAGRLGLRALGGVVDDFDPPPGGFGRDQRGAGGDDVGAGGDRTDHREPRRRLGLAEQLAAQDPAEPLAVEAGGGDGTAGRRRRGRRRRRPAAAPRRRRWSGPSGEPAPPGSGRRSTRRAAAARSRRGRRGLRPPASRVSAPRTRRSRAHQPVRVVEAEGVDDARPACRTGGRPRAPAPAHRGGGVRGRWRRRAGRSAPRCRAARRTRRGSRRRAPRASGSIGDRRRLAGRARASGSGPVATMTASSEAVLATRSVEEAPSRRQPRRSAGSRRSVPSPRRSG